MLEFLRFLSNAETVLVVVGIGLLLIAIIGELQSPHVSLNLSRFQRWLSFAIGCILITLGCLPTYLGDPVEDVPPGAILAWEPQIRDGDGTVVAGRLNDVPYGWKICNGSNGTPDLTDRFVLGTATPTEAGQTGGTSQIPNDTVSISGTTGKERIDRDRKGGFETDEPDTQTGSHIHDLELKVQPHNHGGEFLPPYYKLVYIMKQYPS